MLSKKPRAQWPMCGDELTAYVKEKALMHGKGMEIEEFNLQSINDDVEYMKKMQQMQKEFNAQNAENKASEAPTPSNTPAPSNDSPNPYANGMDMKKIITVVVVIIILIVGYFMK